MKQKVIIGIVVAIIIIGGIYLYVNHNKASAPDTNSGTDTSAVDTGTSPGDVPGDNPNNNPTIPTSDTIAVSTQTPGDSVTIDTAFLEKPGFISIHEIDAKGQPGAVVGMSGYLTTGPKQDLEIKATIKPGAKYIAMLRLDDGDKKFDANKDVAVKADNIPVMTIFSISQ